MSDASQLAIGLVGYGEVGKILAGALVQRKLAWVGAWDILLRDATSAAPMKAHAAHAGVDAVGSMAALTARADVIVSAVTASQAWSVADEAARTIRPGTWFVDLNSCSPGTKQRSSERIDAAGGRYVESAVMTTVPQYGIKVPMLLGGREAAALKALLAPLGFSMEVAAERVGVASAIKMCRSVMIKGLEAMVIESFTSARAWGVEDAVVASLAETFPGIDWERQATYFFQRVVQHGRRRAEEMREVAVTVAEAGLEPWSARGTAERQAAMADLADAGAFGERGTLAADWRIYADAILATRRRGS
jgi:3-hydroxyisobutyrate dehydrogenase-like beta-hydroxyacid dehydrogenase